MEPKTCPTCDGDGELATSHVFTCYTCDGTGKVSDPKIYEKALESERECARNMARSVSAMEYRMMGG